MTISHDNTNANGDDAFAKRNAALAELEGSKGVLDVLFTLINTGDPETLTRGSAGATINSAMQHIARAEKILSTI